MNSQLGLMSFACAALLYSTSTVLFYLDVVRGRTEQQGFSRAAPASLGLGAIAHGGYVTIASLIAHVCPIHSSQFILSTAALIAIVVYFVARRRFRIHSLGLLLAPIGLLMTLSIFFLSTAPAKTKLPASFIGLHIFANLCGTAFFLLAAAAAALYLIQERQLKLKKALTARGLPPLDVLDKTSHRFLLAGFPLLTLGLASGTVWSGGLSGPSPDELIRTVLGWTTWLLFATVLLFRVLSGWRGRRAAWGTIAGFVCALIVMLWYALRPWLRGGETIGG
jgi:ABC-type uncharacterized transport system permease subunit